MPVKLKEKYRNIPVQVKAAFWFLICSFLQKGISVITTPIFTRLLTTEEYGQYSVFNSWLGIVTIFVTLRVYSGIYTRQLIKEPKNRDSYSSSMQGLTLVLVAVWCVVYLFTYRFWNSLLGLTTIQMLAMIAMIWTSTVFNLWAGYQRVEYYYRKLVIVTLIVSIAKPIVGIIFVVLAEDKVTARIMGLLLVELIGYTGLFASQMKKGKMFYSKKYWMGALAFNLPLVPHYLSQTVLASSDRIMINSLVGSSAAGIYSLGYSISQIMILFNTSLMHAMSPWLYQKIKDKRAQEIAPISYITIIFVEAVNLLLIAIAPEVVALFAPGSYHEAVWMIPPIAMSVVFMFSYDLFAKFQFYFEKTRWVMMASIIGAVVNVILNYIFIRLFGYIAAAYTTLFCYILYDIAHYYFMKKVSRKYMDGVAIYNTKKLLVMYMMFICAGFILMITYKQAIIRYFIIVIALVIVLIKRKLILKQMKTLLSIKKK